MAKKVDERKGKVIHLEKKTLRYFSIEAAKSGTSTKSFIEKILEKLAND